MDRTELERAVGTGMSIAQLAETFGRSKGSIRYWLRSYGLQTTNRAKRESTDAARAARAAGLKTFVQECRRHGESVFALEARGYYRCTRCRSDHVSARRRRVKELLIEEAGGACVACGYRRSRRALEFHHVDPSTKAFGLGDGVTVSFESLRDEARKCVLLCSNCHAEVEDGIRSVAVK